MKYHTKLTFKVYWQQIRNYKLSALVMLLSVIGASVVSVVIPLYLKNFFDTLAGSGSREMIVDSLISILLIIAGLELLQWGFWRSATFTAAYFYAKVMADLSNYCFQYLHRHSFSFFNNNFTGSLVRRVNKFVKAFDGIADRFTWDLLPLVVNIIIIIAVLISRNLILGAVMVSWIIIFLVVNWFFVRYKLKYDIKRSEVDSQVTGFLADTITNNANLKLFNGYQREVRGFGLLNEKLRKLRRFTWDLGNVFEAIQGFLMISLEIGIFYLAIRLWQKDILTLGDFVLLQAYVINIFMRIWNFGRTIQRIYEDLSDAEEMTIILNTPYEIQDIKSAKKLKVTKGEIEFKEVSFYYHQTRRVVTNLNLTIRSGEKLALVGPSGAGKTTLAKLLLRMHDVTGGKILIDDQRVFQVSQESLWQNVSLVPQEPILFHRSLKENICYGQPKATTKEVIKAAKLAHCHEFIIDLPQGYNTYVGERGVKLSGGERQRVAIARAILRNAPILILDEATSSLDSESEHLIQDALSNLMKGKTVIVIAHRLSTIMKMDRIILIDEGKIKEEGTHQELLNKKGGLYKKLWQIQAGGFIS